MKNKLAVFVEGNYFVKQVGRLWIEYFQNKRSGATPSLSSKQFAALLKHIVEEHLEICDRELYRVYFYDQSIFSWAVSNQLTKEDNITIQSTLEKQLLFNRVFMTGLIKELNIERKYKIRRSKISPLEIRGPKKTFEEDSRLLEQGADVLGQESLSLDFNRFTSDILISHDMTTSALRKTADTFVLITDDLRFTDSSSELRELGLEIIIEPLSNQLDYTIEKHFDWISQVDIVKALRNLTEYRLQKEPDWWDAEES